MSRTWVIVLLIAAGLLIASSAGWKGPSGSPGTSQTTSLTGPTIEVFQTGPRPHDGLIQLPSISFGPADTGAGRGQVIRVDDQRRFQPIWGVGATVTNSSSFLLMEELGPVERAHVIEQVFGAQGAHLSWIGVTIGGSDFNAGGLRYSEDDMPPGQTDPQLTHFSLTHDQNTIAVLRAALRINPSIRVIARPWSAPAWMKANNSLTNNGFAGVLEPQYYPVYARYFVKYLEGFSDAGIPIYAITAQNEPVNVPASYEGMDLSAADEGYFIRQFLRPALRHAGLETRIYGLDESWQEAPYARRAYSAAGGLAGIAWHCYDGNPDVVMPQFHAIPQVLSECANGLIRSPPAPLLTNVFNDGASAAGLWNLALDPSGGPVVQPDTACPACHGVITVDPVSRSVRYSHDFYELAQFGKFLRPGAERIAATRLGRFRNQKATNRASLTLHDVAFVNSDGSIVLVLYNNSSESTRVTILCRSRAASTSIAPHTTSTFVWKFGA